MKRGVQSTKSITLLAVVSVHITLTMKVTKSSKCAESGGQEKRLTKTQVQISIICMSEECCGHNCGCHAPAPVSEAELEKEALEATNPLAAEEALAAQRFNTAIQYILGIAIGAGLVFFVISLF